MSIHQGIRLLGGTVGAVGFTALLSLCGTDGLDPSTAATAAISVLETPTEQPVAEAERTPVERTLVDHVANPDASAIVALHHKAGLSPTHANVAYTGCASCIQQQLDIYLPTTPARGVLVYYHQGGFYTGDKYPLNEAGLIMAQLDRGWIVVSANYRTVVGDDPNSSTRLLSDARAAADWVLSPAASGYGIPSGVPVVTAGLSAGGTLAAIVALEMPPGSIDGWVSVSGILDWHAGPNSTHWSNVLHQGAPWRADALELFSPTAPPGYLIHGMNDTIVEPANLANAVNASQAAGGPHLSIDEVDVLADGADLGINTSHVPFGGANASEFNNWLDGR